MSSFAESAARANAAQLRVFGEVVQYQAGGAAGIPVNITVIWTDADANMPSGIAATAWALESTFTSPAAKNDIIYRGSSRYRVVDPPNGVAYQRDGNGGITLYLRRGTHAADA